MRIDRCICTNSTFAQLLRRAREEGLTWEELSETTGAGHGCGRCMPYLRQALRTGQTVFHQIICDDEPVAAANADS